MNLPKVLQAPIYGDYTQIRAHETTHEIECLLMVAIVAAVFGFREKVLHWAQGRLNLYAVVFTPEDRGCLSRE